mmetsp:Transcript_4405/g.5440  ORF Transcript_4405/g.5440 Transcript_4405/m.5440 type:complete len:94 (+) Transcript_4405:1459-1740(+)
MNSPASFRCCAQGTVKMYKGFALICPMTADNVLPFLYDFASVLVWILFRVAQRGKQEHTIAALQQLLLCGWFRSFTSLFDNFIRVRRYSLCIP